MMRVLHIVRGFDLSGRSRMIHDLGLCLAGRGFEVSVVSLADNVGYRQSDIPCRSLGLREGSDLKALSRLAGTVRRERPDWLHSHGRGALPYASVVSAVTGRRLIHTVHRADGDMITNRALVRRLLLSRAHRVVGVSGAACREFVRVNTFPIARTVTIHNGIDPSRFSTAPPESASRPPDASPVLGTVANLSHDKDAETLLDGFTMILDAFPGARLKIVGHGPKAEEVRASAASAGLADRVEFLGFREDVPSILQGFDVFVLSTKTEGLGIALLEAMAAGVPVVASHTGGIPEIVEDGVSGKLFEAGNPAALRDAVLDLLRDDNLRDTIVRAAYDRVVKEFSLDNMCAEYERLYRGEQE